MGNLDNGIIQWVKILLTFINQWVKIASTKEINKQMGFERVRIFLINN
jgi:hypothetical protein